MKRCGHSWFRVVAVVVCSFWHPDPALGQIPDAWQPIPSEDLALKDNPAAPGSAAMILEREIYSDDEKRLQTEWIRIKIFTQQGKNYADVQIPYLSRSTSIEGIRGRTVRADGTVIPFDGLVFDTVLARYKRFRYDAKTFTLPGVEAGSVIEYVYTMRWKQKFPDYLRNRANYSFQDGWTVPSTTWTVQGELFTRHAVFVLRPLKNVFIAWAKVRMKDGPSTQPDGSLRLEAADVPALEHEDYMPPESILNSRLSLYYPVGFLTNYWRDYGKRSAQGAEKFVEKSKFLEREAATITAGAGNPEAKLMKLYARVQQVRNLSNESSKTEQELKRENLATNKSAEDVYRHGYGDRSEINSLFVALARAAGFDAAIVEVVSRDSAFFDRDVPDATQLNALVVQIRLNGNTSYVDPACRFCRYGLLPWYETDTSGVRWDKLGGELIKIPGDEEPSAIERKADLSLAADGTLEGSAEITFTRQEAIDLRESGVDEDDAGRRKLLEERIKRSLPPGAIVDIDPAVNWQQAEEMLRVRCHVRVPRFAVLSSQYMLFSMSVFQAAHNNSVFPQVYRRDPVYLAYGHSGSDHITISLPKDYKVEAVPSDASYDSPVGSFHFKRTLQAGSLCLERRIVRVGYYFPPGSYKILRQFYEELRQKDAENVVFRHGEPTARK